MFTSQVRRIGYAAAKSLSPGTAGRVIGIMSRGFFLLMGEEQVVFVSKEVEASPLTVNLDLPGEGWDAVKMGDAVGVDGFGVRIGEALRLVREGSQVWKPPLPATEDYDLDAIRGRVKRTAEVLIGQKGAVGWAACLARLAGLAAEPVDDEQGMIWRKIEKLRGALIKADMDEVVKAISPLVGLGRGLTPSGDDFVIGLLLVLTRWTGLVRLDGEGVDVVGRIVEGARGRTTRISEAMIASAGVGYADERLLEALDGMVIGTKSSQTCAILLANYGGSSGIDALSGMAAVLLHS